MRGMVGLCKVLLTVAPVSHSLQRRQSSLFQFIFPSLFQRVKNSEAGKMKITLNHNNTEGLFA
jgi:hypothetical protein